MMAIIDLQAAPQNAIGYGGDDTLISGGGNDTITALVGNDLLNG